MGLFSPTFETLRDLYLNELRDLYSAETQLLEALPKMAEAANSSQLKKAFTSHLEQTEGHVADLKRSFTTSAPIVETVNECMHRRSILMKMRWSWEHGFLR